MISVGRIGYCRHQKIKYLAIFELIKRCTPHAHGLELLHQHQDFELIDLLAQLLGRFAIPQPFLPK